nr:thaumatin-like protein 1 [Ziziphus jujuba var. spinosa]
MDYYEVSFKNGYNLPIIVALVGRGSGGDDEHHYSTAGCSVNLISSCPPELRYSDESLGCKSACQAFAEPSFCCCTAAACNCSPNRYTDFFKQACPKANSFVNDKTSTFSYPFEHDFVIIFCPSSSTTRSDSPDKLHKESESDLKGTINYNSKKRNMYALISGVLVLVGALSEIYPYLPPLKEKGAATFTGSSAASVVIAPRSTPDPSLMVIVDK